jgi:2-polyprenyl-6-methoxyphenol hydroxylase-like FAD-dependent oxidoreductase
VQSFYYTANERLPQYETEAVLRRRVAELPAVELVYGWDAQGIRKDDAGATVTLEERGGDGRRVVHAIYAVGCDGSRSRVREQAGLSETRTDHDRLMVLLVFRSRQLHELLSRYPGKSYYNVLQPELEGYWKFFGRVDLGNTWFFHAPVPPGTTADNFDFRAFLHAAVGEAFDVEFEHIGFWDLRFAIADAYRAGNVFSRGMPHTATRRTAGTASTRASRTRATWDGSWRRCSGDGPARSCWTPMTRSAGRCSRRPLASS